MTAAVYKCTNRRVAVNIYNVKTTGSFLASVYLRRLFVYKQQGNCRIFALKSCINNTLYKRHDNMTVYLLLDITISMDLLIRAQ